ncbi:MAG: hypothetical protein GVY30_08240 [Chloroflexi bacterium]|jgi:hypothetical protein|nr:hypothetical protein [Chloroflexota bacterium]
MADREGTVKAAVYSSVSVVIAACITGFFLLGNTLLEQGIVVVGPGLQIGNPQSESVTPTRSPETISFEVIASLPWQNTNIQLQSGDFLQIEYKSGQWCGDVNLGGYSGPDNLDIVEEEPDLACLPLPGTRSEGRPALIGRIGNDEPFNIGRQFVGTISGDGFLFLRINDCDDYLFDNDGSLVVDIQAGK